MASCANGPGLPDYPSQVPQSSLYFCHIPKCAGTAVTLRLEPAYSWNESFLSMRSLEGKSVHELTLEERARFQAVMGHNAEAIREEFFPHFHGMTGIRHPHERFVSFYKHAARSRRFDPVLHDLAIGRDPNYFDQLDRRECFRQRISSLAYLIDLETKREHAGPDKIDRQLEAALRTLDQYALVYTDDKINVADGELSYALGQPPLPSLPVANEAKRFGIDYGDVPIDVPRLFEKYFPYEMAIYERAKQRSAQCLGQPHSLEDRTAAYNARWKAFSDRDTELRFDPGQPFCGVNWGWRMRSKFEPYVGALYLRLNGRCGFLDLPFHLSARHIEIVLWSNNRAVAHAAKLTCNGTPCEVRPAQEGRFTKLRASLRSEHIGEFYTRVQIDVPHAGDGDAGTFLFEISTSRIETCISRDPVKRPRPMREVNLEANTEPSSAMPQPSS